MSSRPASPLGHGRVIAIAFAVCANALQGCSTVLRPYAHFEQEHFRDAPTPTIAEIHEYAETTLPVGASADAVWNAALFLAHQRGGIVRAGRDANGTRFVQFIDTPSRSFLPYLEQLNPDEPGFTVVTWLAVSVRAESDRTARVAIAWVQPESGRPGPIEGYAGRATLGAVEERKSIARFAISEFLQALQAQVLGPKRWSHALEAAVPGGALRRTAVMPQSRPPIKVDKAVETGHGVSRSIQEQFYLLDLPEVTDQMDRIVARLSLAAGRDASPFRTRLIASRKANASSLPNGDIYVTTQLLESVTNQAELAGVLAHEIDHYLQDDYMATAIEGVAAMNRSFNAYAIGATVLIVGICAAYPEYCFKAQTSGGATAEQTAGASAAALGFIGGFTFWAIASIDHVSASISGYSRPQELRADHNASIYMWRAGYPADGLLRYLERHPDYDDPANWLLGRSRDSGATKQ